MFTNLIQMIKPFIDMEQSKRDDFPSFELAAYRKKRKVRNRIARESRKRNGGK